MVEDKWFIFEGMYMRNISVIDGANAVTTKRNRRNPLGAILFGLSAMLTVSSLTAQIVLNPVGHNRYITIKNAKWGVQDSIGKIIVPLDYDQIESKNDRLIVRKKDKWGLLTMDNQVVLAVINDRVLARGNNRFIVWNKGLQGLIDTGGKKIIGIQYVNVSSLGVQDEYYVVKNSQGYSGVYDFEGVRILPEKYHFYTVDGYKVFAEANGQPFILDVRHPNPPTRLDLQIKFVETLRHYSMDEKLFQIIVQQGKYGLIDSDNKEIIPARYDKIQSSSDWRYFIFKENGKYGLIRVHQGIVAEPLYDTIIPRKEGAQLKTTRGKDVFSPYVR